MADIEIHMLNHALVGIQADYRISEEMRNFFSVYADNYRWSPKYKSGFWDGKLRFMKDNAIQIGLIDQVYVFAKLGGYTVECKFDRKLNIDVEEFKRFVASLKITDGSGHPMKPRAYQLQAAYDALNLKHLSIESVTASGKSLILYIIIRFFHLTGRKTLLIVPRTQLVDQMIGDFEEYGWGGTRENIHMIYSGQKKVFDAPIICSTWQSLYKDKSLFQQFDALMVDEAHGAKGQSIGDIGRAAVNAEHRIGSSGTYPEKGTADWHNVVGTLGPIKVYNTYKSLQSDGHIAEMQIKVVKLQYPNEFRKRLFLQTQGDYMLENDVLIQHPDRDQVIVDLVKKTKGNTIVLFTKIEKHGKRLHEKFLAELDNKRVFYIDGSIKTEKREQIRGVAERTAQIWKIFKFEDKKIVKVLADSLVPLNNGKSKKAKDITIEDNINDEWILKNFNK